MQKLIGTVMTADGSSSGLLKPVMPTPPSMDLINSLQSQITAIQASQDQKKADWNTAMAVKQYTTASNLQIDIQSLEVKKQSLISQLASAKTQYNADYAAYQEKVTQYNKDYADWAAATAKLNATDPEVIKAQIEAQTAAQQIQANLQAAGNKKYIIIAGIVIALVIAGAFAYYIVKKKKG